eukprot:83136_1
MSESRMINKISKLYGKSQSLIRNKLKQFKIVIYHQLNEIQSLEILRRSDLNVEKAANWYFSNTNKIHKISNTPITPPPNHRNTRKRKRTTMIIETSKRRSSRLAEQAENAGHDSDEPHIQVKCIYKPRKKKDDIIQKK